MMTTVTLPVYNTANDWVSVQETSERSHRCIPYVIE